MRVTLVPKVKPIENAVQWDDTNTSVAEVINILRLRYKVQDASWDMTSGILTVSVINHALMVFPIDIPPGEYLWVEREEDGETYIRSMSDKMVKKKYTVCTREGD